eukprot:GHVL01009858.1.p1 GENE.GHVL01009858.1~~GHVL01009858.1.p1  ORF type:complete len:282 (-),score=35.78 GHVL01009858.1:1903-2748(-)
MRFFYLLVVPTQCTCNEGWITIANGQGWCMQEEVRRKIFHKIDSSQEGYEQPNDINPHTPDENGGSGKISFGSIFRNLSIPVIALLCFAPAMCCCCTCGFCCMRIYKKSKKIEEEHHPKTGRKQQSNSGSPQIIMAHETYPIQSIQAVAPQHKWLDAPQQQHHNTQQYLNYSLPFQHGEQQYSEHAIAQSQNYASPPQQYFGHSTAQSLYAMPPSNHFNRLPGQSPRCPPSLKDGQISSKMTHSPHPYLMSQLPNGFRIDQTSDQYFEHGRRGGPQCQSMY